MPSRPIFKQPNSPVRYSRRLRYALIAIALLILFQLAFTCLAPLQILFGTTAIALSLWFYS